MTCDSSHILVGFSNGTVELFSRHPDYKTTKTTRTHPFPRELLLTPVRDVDKGQEVTALDLSPKYILVGNKIGSVQVWCRSTGRLAFLGSGDGCTITCIRLAESLEAIVVSRRDEILISKELFDLSLGKGESHEEDVIVVKEKLWKDIFSRTV